MRIALVIGHYENDKGAHSKHLNESEWDMWYNFYESHLIGFGDIFIHSNNSSYSRRQDETAKKTKDYDLVFEMHFNAASESAHGVEALVYAGNEKMIGVGQFFCNAIEAFMGYRNRGVKEISSGNGFGFLSKTKGDAILLEPFFGSNKKDCERYDADQYKEVITKTINLYKSLNGVDESASERLKNAGKSAIG